MIKILLPLLGYLFGSVSSAIVVSKLMDLPDPRGIGSGNPGATNVLRSGSKLGAGLTLLGDILKGTIPVALAMALKLNPVIVAMVGFAAFLGHLYPLFFGFKGGKGVATACGIFIGLSPAIAGALLAVWLGCAVAFRYSSLAALIAAAAAPFLVLAMRPQIPYVVLAAAIAIVLFWRHKDNIQRLKNGTEGKIELRKKLP